MVTPVKLLFRVVLATLVSWMTSDNTAYVNFFYAALRLRRSKKLILPHIPENGIFL
jgi:hypothetical protein